ncbi:MAG: hypothetical protein ABSG03_06130 [Bryobacteraceae bacterium]
MRQKFERRNRSHPRLYAPVDGASPAFKVPALGTEARMALDMSRNVNLRVDHLGGKRPLPT